MKGFIKFITIIIALTIMPVSVFGKNVMVNLTTNATASVMIEATTGKVLYEFNANKVVSVASLTKMMSLIIVFEFIEQGGMTYDEEITVSKNAQDMGGTQLWLAEGDKITLRDLIKGIVMSSANDAMYAVAERVAGTEEAFVTMMNNKAKELGLKNTSFKNCIGFDEKGQHSTAYDMALIAKELIKHEEIFSFSGVYEDYIRKGTDKEAWISNTNKLVRFYEGADGLKTGYTDDAGSCICATAMKNNLRLIVVSLGYKHTKERNSETMELLNYGFNQYKANVIYKKGEKVTDIKLLKGEKERVSLTAKSDILILQKKTDKDIDYKKEIKIKGFTYPLYKGDELGVLYIKDNDKIIAKGILTINENIKKVGYFKLFITNLKNVLGGN